MSTYQREKSPARALFVGGAMIVLLVVLFLVYRNSQQPKAPEPSLASFRSEVAALSLPAGTMPEPTNT